MRYSFPLPSRSTARAMVVAVMLSVGLLLSVHVRAQVGEITYVYDDLGRLVAVIAADGETAVYSYDVVGNLLSITRLNSSAVAVIHFTPSTGSEGSVVTLYGIGFSTTASQNTVNFNGIAATVTSSTATQLVTSVPVGATTGLISVTTPGGSANSATPFVVIGSTAPTITSFTPTIGTPGTELSITGTNFELTPPNNRVLFNGVTLASGASATETVLNTSAPLGTSGPISVTTSLGKAVSTQDFFIPPAPYTVANVEQTGRMAMGESKAVTINTVGNIALILFEGTAGQHVSLETSDVTIPYPYYAAISIISPGGTIVGNATTGWYGWPIDIGSLPLSGTYTILINPQSGAVGSLNLALTSIADATANVVAGGAPVSVSTSSSGQNARVTFSGTLGQRLSLVVDEVVSAGGSGSVLISIKAPNGSVLYSGYLSQGNNFIDAYVLQASGTYTILLDPVDTTTVTARLTLIDVPADIADTITPGGNPLTVTTTVFGQNARAMFSGSQGQRVSLKVTGTLGESNGVVVCLKDSSDNCLVWDYMSGDPFFMDTLTLPATGTYMIFLDPVTQFAGSLTLTLYNVPADGTGTITPGGNAVTVTTTVPGQNAKLTFGATEGRRVSLSIANVSIAASDVSILKPDGTALISEPVDTNGKFIDAFTLPTAGTYTVFIDPSGMSIGSMTFTLHDATDATASITRGGPAVTITTTAPGQNAKLTFAGTASDAVTLKISGVTIAGLSSVSIKQPNGAAIAWEYVDAIGGFIDIASLPATGDYSIYIDPTGANTGGLTLRLYDELPVDPNAPTITELSPTIGSPGTALAITGTHFHATTSENRVLLNTQVLSPEGSITETTINTTVPVTGSGRISVTTANGKAVSSQDFFVVPEYFAATDLEFTGRMNVGQNCTATIETSDKIGMMLFDGSAGQRVSLNVSGVTLTGDAFVNVLSPAGGFLDGTYVSSYGGGLEVIDLPSSGTYTILIDPYGSSTGSLNLTLADVPPDITGTIAVNGAPVTVTTVLPGQRVRLTFVGTTPDVITVGMTDNTIGSVNAKLISPEGYAYQELTSSDSAFELYPQTLYSSGTHTILIKPTGNTSGTITISLTSQ